MSKNGCSEITIKCLAVGIRGASTLIYCVCIAHTHTYIYIYYRCILRPQNIYNVPSLDLTRLGKTLLVKEPVGERPVDSVGAKPRQTCNQH